jgi:hypothetical protein
VCILIQAAADPKHPKKCPNFPPSLENKEREIKSASEELQPIIPNECS